MKVDFKHIQIGMMFILVWNLIRENLFLSIVYLTGNCMIIQALDQNEKLHRIFFFVAKDEFSEHRNWFVYYF